MTFKSCFYGRIQTVRFKSNTALAFFFRGLQSVKSFLVCDVNVQLFLNLQIFVGFICKKQILW